MRILIAEDDQVLADGLMRGLQGLGFFGLVGDGHVHDFSFEINGLKRMHPNQLDA